MVLGGPAAAQTAERQQDWSVTLYTGPWSQKYLGAVLQDFNLQSRNLLAGAAVDYRIVRLHQDIWLSGELQATQTYQGHSDTTVAANLGIVFDRLFGDDHASFSIYTGPSYALNPAYVSIGYKHRTYPAFRKKFLNDVAMELAVGVPSEQNLDWVVRLYHRSGAYGVYSIGDDEGVGVGLGLRYRFPSE